MSAPPQQGCSLFSALPVVLALSGGVIGWYAMGGWGIAAGIVLGFASCAVPLFLFALTSQWLRKRAKGKRNR